MLFSSRLIAFIWIVGFAFASSVAARLPAQELESLSVVARNLGKSDWNFDGEVDPCTEELPWWNNSDPRNANGVKCDCNSFGNDTCHVIEIILKKQNLNGSLPSELAGLPYLQTIDLARNYLSGFIPREWGSIDSLKKISILGNRLTGPIPKELANITALEELALEANEFTGPIPWEFGDLPRIKKFQLTSNNLTGELPTSLAKLTTLEEFRISDNNFTGSIPNYILNWINITRIEIQASGLTGPIPSNLTSLTKLEDLRISDLNGGQSGFPILATSTSWEQVILRSCNIVGGLPEFVVQLEINKSLDLSFNKLTGPIPRGLFNRGGDIYLTGNSLTGTVPESMQNNGKFDLSYNNFTPVSSEESKASCAQDRPNLFANSKGNTSGPFYCVRSRCKPNDFYSFHINCGSDQNYNDFEADSFDSSNFFQAPGSNWGFSSTGQYLNPANYGDSLYYSVNSTIPGPDSKLYTNARLSPLSLTYFGFCLRNGNYTVNLHFAEIMFTNDITYKSLGRRIFDIYIQGNRVGKDFNIRNEPGGVNMPKIMNYTAVVDDHTLEIRFYWAGKGTTSLPERSVYGPLISAISVVHKGAQKGISDAQKYAIIGVLLGVVIIVIISIICYFAIPCALAYQKSNPVVDKFLVTHGSLAQKRYRYYEIKKMTRSFNDKLGQGGFGIVYKGVLPDGQPVAVKVLTQTHDDDAEEFINEVASISRTSHVNIVNLLGFCYGRKKRALVYEFMPNRSLDKFICTRGSTVPECSLELDKLYGIAVGVARGLEYLHRGCNTRIVHFDIKPQNILLDEDFRPKISDFGLAKLCMKKQSIISMHGMRGTIGYIAPEVFSRNFGVVSHKSDVYSYGMMLLEMAEARKVVEVEHTQSSESYFPDNIYELVLLKKEIMGDMVGDEKEESEIKMLMVGVWCIQTAPVDRPLMSKVLEMLEGSLQSIQIPPKPFFPLQSGSVQFSSSMNTDTQNST